ncbi:MAG: PilW family protein [Candidatus Kerfeldbacteria bacterium]
MSKQQKLNNSGFTLIEMLIAISIFSLVLIVATNIYITINNSQRKVVTQQKIQDDIRFLFEAIAQEIRLGSINYDFYENNNINLHTGLGGSDNSILAINSQSGDEIFFRRSSDPFNTNNGQGNKVEYCTVNDFNDCALDDDTLWQSVTPAGVETLDLRFAITPSANPFVETSTVSCTSNAECDLGYVCDTIDDYICEYDSDGQNFQPKVRFVLNSRGIGRNKGEESEILMQTIISTRIFTGAVQNLNYEL